MYMGGDYAVKWDYGICMKYNLGESSREGYLRYDVTVLHLTWLPGSTVILLD